MAMGHGTEIHDLLPAYDPTLRPATSGQPIIGQVVNTVVPSMEHPWQMFDAHRSDQQTHASVSGTIRKVDHQKDYRHKPTRLPVFQLRLGSCEELLAIKSKVRPCVVLATADGIPDLQLPPADRGIARAAFLRPTVLVAPLFSVSTPREPKAITAAIAARAECLVYPQLVFLPRSGLIIQNDSVLRLDRAFWTTLPPPTELCALSLSKERMKILDGQLLTLHGRQADQDYVEMVELLRSVLAPEHAKDLP